MASITLPAGLRELEAYQAAKSLPPVHDWHPAHCGDSRMHIADDGVWFHDGAPITKPALVRLFSTILRKDADGFVLVTPSEKLSIAVEDAPFIAVLLTVEGSGSDQRLSFTTNVGEIIPAGPGHELFFRLRDGAPVPYLHVRHGLNAKAARAVYYQLADLLVLHQNHLGVWSNGVFFAAHAT